MLDPRTEKCRQAIALLRKTATGRALIEAVYDETISITEIAGLASSGITKSKNEMQVKQEIMALPNMAVVIGHELTHCLDLIYWHINPEPNSLGTLMTPSQIGRSEVNAHFNQGKIVRELRQLAQDRNSGFDQGLIDEINAMANAATTFGQSEDWKDRLQVKKYLMSTDTYRSSVQAASEHNNMFDAWSDAYWCDDTEEFHSEDHFNDSNRWGNAAWVARQRN